jgi:hypothetical protein
VIEVEACQQMGPMDVANAECAYVASGDVRASVNVFSG